MVIKSLSSVGKWIILITTIYILYEKRVLSLNSVFGIINYAKAKLKNINITIPTTSSPPSEAVEIDLGNDFLSDMLPFDIHESPQRDKPKIIVPKWGVWLIANGSILMKKAMPRLISRIMEESEGKSSDPNHPLENPYNDIKLIKSILDEIDKL